MTSLRRHTLLAVLAAAALAVAGCGGDSDSTGGDGDTQPTADLVKQADEICLRNDEERPKAPTIPADASAAELKKTVDYFETDLELTRRTRDELAELTPPEGQEERWQTVLDGYDAVVAAYPDLIDAAKAGDDKAFVHVVGQIQQETEDLRPAAAEIGLQVCAAAG